MNLKLFADGAKLEDIKKLNSNPKISGFTTNPSLMRQAGIRDYEKFAKDVLQIIEGKPIALEVIADDFSEIERQARIIASWGPNINVKIPIMTTSGNFCGSVIERLSNDGIVVNVTAIMTVAQVEAAIQCISRDVGSFISVFAGRIADTGRDPIPVMEKSIEVIKGWSKSELIWASPREVLNVVQAQNIGCHILTATTGILSKIDILDKDLHKFSQETVQMFYDDAVNSGFKL